MATPINRQHAANLVAKTNRFVAVLDRVGALKTPAALIQLERSSDTGKLLADDGWDRLADLVCEATGRARETAPSTTRQAIAEECMKLLAFRAVSPEDPAVALTGL